MRSPFPLFVVPPVTDAERGRRRRVAFAVFATAAVAVGTASLPWAVRLPVGVEASSVTIGAVASFLLLPASAWLVTAWVRHGEPPELNLSPLFPTRDERAFHRTLEARPGLDDDAFFAAFYADTGVPPDLPARLRADLAAALGFDREELESLHPRDPLGLLDPEVDFADLFWRLERTFGITLPRAEWATWDGTFDGLVRWVRIRSAARAGEPGV